MTYVGADITKQGIRERMWALLENAGAGPANVHGRIPNFVGADLAAARLAGLAVWRTAQVVKAVPDKAQRAVRARALGDGKLLYMAVSRLAEKLPFVELDPTMLGVSPDEAADRRVAASVGRAVDVGEMRPVDLVVCGSVAVDRRGARLGKGAGYSDIEVALLAEAGLIGPDTRIVTTVHPLQVVDEALPETGHDFSVDLIVTSDEVIACGPPRRPRGVDWRELDERRIAAIPALAARDPRRRKLGGGGRG